MIQDLLLPLYGFVGLMIWAGAKHVVQLLHWRKQVEIVRRGVTTQGKVVGIQRPFMLDACTRLYFDFLPEGADRPLRVCHVLRLSSDQAKPALPITGAVVTVHYLPDHPRRAVISRLVPAAEREEVSRQDRQEPQIIALTRRL